VKDILGVFLVVQIPLPSQQVFGCPGYDKYPNIPRFTDSLSVFSQILSQEFAHDGGIYGNFICREPSKNKS